MRDVGINGHLGRWIGKFLLDRKQKVKVNGAFSNLIDVLSGVPQGSILGPLLFIIFINDIYSKAEHSKISSYADDTKMSKKISGDADKVLLQKDLDNIFLWSEQNLMVFNSDKLEHIRFSSTKMHDEVSSYFVPDGSNIKPVSMTRDLGITFDSCLSFEPHILEKAAKAKKTLWIYF